MNAEDIFEALKGGSSTALIVSVYFIYKCEGRLARIEKALERFLTGSVDDGKRDDRNG